MSPSPHPASRYRRRILGLGAVAAGALYVIGAPFFVDGVENDLERRVPEALAEAGFDDVTVAFSGQDGTITCAAPLSDPDGALAVAFDVRGVRDIELVQSDDSPCRVRTAPAGDEPGDSGDTAGAGSDDPSSDDASNGDASSGDDSSSVASADDSDDGSDDGTSGSTDRVATTTDTDLAAVRDVVAANPDLAFVSELLAGVDLGADGDAVTLFAPSNAAFDAVPADVLGQLQDDSDLLTRVLRHHAIAGAVLSGDLTVGDVEALDGSMLAIDVADDGAVTVDGVNVVEPDIAASNGVVHVIDALLLPDGVDVAARTAAATAGFDGTSITLSGVVASEVERAVVVDAAVTALGAAAVTDDMTVDPDTGVQLGLADRIADLIAALPGNVASGTVGFDGTVVFADVVAASADGGAAFAAVAESIDVEPAIEVPPGSDEDAGDTDTDTGDETEGDATDDDAAVLEAALNAFVADNPIRFAPGSATLDDAGAVLDRVATDLQRVDGIAVTVEGHTDSDGDPADNLALSEQRAAAVRAALIERGVDAAFVDAVGFGSEQPVLVDGVEDKIASRRVEFRVAATS